jgi:hypothetical protein
VLLGVLIDIELHLVALRFERYWTIGKLLRTPHWVPNTPLNSERWLFVNWRVPFIWRSPVLLVLRLLSNHCKRVLGILTETVISYLKLTCLLALVLDLNWTRSLNLHVVVNHVVALEVSIREPLVLFELWGLIFLPRGTNTPLFCPILNLYALCKPSMLDSIYLRLSYLLSECGRLFGAHERFRV